MSESKTILPPNGKCPHCGFGTFTVRYAAVVEDEAFARSDGSIARRSELKPWRTPEIAEVGSQVACICWFCEKEIPLHVEAEPDTFTATLPAADRDTLILLLGGYQSEAAGLSMLPNAHPSWRGKAEIIGRLVEALQAGK